LKKACRNSTGVSRTKTSIWAVIPEHSPWMVAYWTPRGTATHLQQFKNLHFCRNLNQLKKALFFGKIVKIAQCWGIRPQTPVGLRRLRLYFQITSLITSLHTQGLWLGYRGYICRGVGVRQ